MKFNENSRVFLEGCSLQPMAFCGLIRKNYGDGNGFFFKLPPTLYRKGEQNDSISTIS